MHPIRYLIAPKTDSIFVMPSLWCPDSTLWTSNIMLHSLYSPSCPQISITHLIPQENYGRVSPQISKISLAASPDIIDFQRNHVRIQQKLQNQWAIANTESALRIISRLRDSLYASFEAEPLEDGMDHSAEELIKEAMEFPDYAGVLDWFYSTCLDVDTPAFSSSLLRCLGRQTRLGSEFWRCQLIYEALTVDNVLIRDAALQAAEFWGGSKIRQILEIMVKSEPIHWLRDYMLDVIEDLR